MTKIILHGHEFSLAFHIKNRRWFCVNKGHWYSLIIPNIGFLIHDFQHGRNNKSLYHQNSHLSCLSMLHGLCNHLWCGTCTTCTHIFAICLTKLWSHKLFVLDVPHISQSAEEYSPLLAECHTTNAALTIFYWFISDNIDQECIIKHHTI